MFSDEGDTLSAVVQITAGAGGNRKLWLGRNAHAHIHDDVGEKYGYKIKELNSRKEKLQV
jgi:peptide chain release factor 2